MSAVAERVAGGMALLDERRPGWLREMAPQWLDIADCLDCTLGQVYGRYDDGMKALGLAGHDAAARLGFTCTVGPSAPDEIAEAEFAALTAEWRRAIEARGRPEYPCMHQAGGRSVCTEDSPDGILHCTRPLHAEGPHVAHGDDHAEIGRWAASADDAA